MLVWPWNTPVPCGSSVNVCYNRVTLDTSVPMWFWCQYLLYRRDLGTHGSLMIITSVSTMSAWPCYTSVPRDSDVSIDVSSESLKHVGFSWLWYQILSISAWPWDTLVPRGSDASICRISVTLGHVLPTRFWCQYQPYQCDLGRHRSQWGSDVSICYISLTLGHFSPSWFWR